MVRCKREAFASLPQPCGHVGSSLIPIRLAAYAACTTYTPLDSIPQGDIEANAGLAGKSNITLKEVCHEKDTIWFDGVRSVCGIAVDWDCWGTTRSAA